MVVIIVLRFASDRQHPAPGVRPPPARPYAVRFPAPYGGPVGGDAAQMMVGRDRELARVTLFLDDALAGRGRPGLCTGEAGIGKTRLGGEAAVLAAARGVWVAWARAADRGSSPPYGLWRLVLDEPALRAADGDPSRADLWSAVF